jgi:COP9 signalosome complex subunit 1
VLCSLAVLDRRELKSSVLYRPNVNTILESDTQARDLMEAFFACEYKKTLILLEKMKIRSLLDIHLSPHYTNLIGQITRRALRQFVQPFDSLRVERLATSMGWQGEEGENKAIDQLIELIQSKEIDGKLDIIDRVSIKSTYCILNHSGSFHYFHRSTTPTRKTHARPFLTVLSRWVNNELHQPSASSCE